MQRHYGAGQMLVVAAGAVTHDLLSALIESRLGHIADATTAKRQPAVWQGSRQIVERQLEQSHIILACQ